MYPLLRRTKQDKRTANKTDWSNHVQKGNLNNSSHTRTHTHTHSTPMQQILLPGHPSRLSLEAPTLPSQFVLRRHASDSHGRDCRHCNARGEDALSVVPKKFHRLFKEVLAMGCSGLDAKKHGCLYFFVLEGALCSGSKGNQQENHHCSHIPTLIKQS